MLSYKKILVPYDGSEHAKKALQQAIAIAEDGEGAKLFVASVCNMVSAMSNFDQVSIAEGCLDQADRRSGSAVQGGSGGSQGFDSERGRDGDDL